MRGACLRHGVNLTNWFRYPPSIAPAALDAYLSDDAIATLHHAGFDFVRLAVQPSLLDRTANLRRAIARLHAASLSVVVDLHPVDGKTDAAPLDDFWMRLAPALAGTDPRRTVPELVNEPVYAGRATEWAARQDRLVAIVRNALPHHTVLCTGGDWGSLDGLLAAPPPADPNTIMSFHFYEPAAVTTATPPDPKAPWSAATTAARIARAAAWSREHGVRVLAGEFGASVRLDAPARLAWLEATRLACERENIGWAMWGLEDVHGFDLPRPPPRRPVLDPAVLAALGLRPG